MPPKEMCLVSTYITQRRHLALRLEAAKTGTAISRMVEEWINPKIDAIVKKHDSGKPAELPDDGE